MPRPTKVEINELKRKCIAEFPEKLEKEDPKIDPVLQTEAIADYTRALNPGVFGTLGKYARALISPAFAPFRTMMNKNSKFREMIHDIGPAGGALLFVAAVSAISAASLIAVPLGIGAIAAIMTKGTWNCWQTFRNGADYHPFSGRTGVNKEVSAAYSSSKAGVDVPCEAIKAQYRWMGDDIIKKIVAKQNKLNTKDLKESVIVKPVELHEIQAGSSQTLNTTVQTPANPLGDKDDEKGKKHPHL